MARRRPRFYGAIAGGGVSLPLAEPPTEELRSLVSSATGGAVGITKVSPAATYYNGTVYFGYVSNAGAVQVASYDVESETTSTPVTLATGGESHAAPSVWVRPSDNRILVFWALHDAATPYVAVSQNSEDVSAFGAAQALHSQLGASADYTYMSVEYLSSTSTLYMFWRDYTGSTGRLAYSTSSNGTAWATRTLLVTADAGAGNVVYWRVRGNGTDRIDITTTNSDRSDSRPTSLYHLYHSAGGTAWYKSDGTEITATRPFAAGSATLIKDSSDGNLDPGDLVSGSNPSCVFQAYQSAGTANDLWYGKWNGSSWSLTEVAASGGIIGGNRYVGGSTMTDADTLYFPKKDTKFEVFRFTTSDGGASFGTAQLTSASAKDAMLLQRVHNGPVGLRTIWSRGDWTNDSTYTLGVEGWG